MTNPLKAVQIVENVILAENVINHVIIVTDAMKKQRKMIAAINIQKRNQNPVKKSRIHVMYPKNVEKIK
jgi:hypothetical protein